MSQAVVVVRFLQLKCTAFPILVVDMILSVLVI